MPQVEALRTNACEILQVLVHPGFGHAGQRRVRRASTSTREKEHETEKEKGGPSHDSSVATTRHGGQGGEGREWAEGREGELGGQVLTRATSGRGLGGMEEEAVERSLGLESGAELVAELVADKLLATLVDAAKEHGAVMETLPENTTCGNSPRKQHVARWRLDAFQR